MSERRKRSASEASAASTASASTKASASRPGKRANGNAKANRGQVAKQLLKSLITLDSYEQDVSDDIQLEGVWNEARDSGQRPAQASSSSSGSAESGEAATGADPNTEAESPANTKSAAELAFDEHEKELDAALPEEYRKFRPRGYGFKLPPTDRPVRVYADGVFDLFHLGHMKQLEQAKKSLPNVVMIVGVPNDELTHQYKGLTVLKDEQRYESLRHCRWVDEVVPNAPWIVTREFLDEHAIDYVAHDDEPYAGPNGTDDVYKFVKERGQFLTTQRTNGISTSDIITKIVKDYDLYLMRNFKRGVSRKELNVSWMKKNEIDIKRHVNAFRESWRHNVETTKKDLYADLLAFALNAPSNSVLGRARDWVSKRIESHQNSPDVSVAGSEANSPHESNASDDDDSGEDSEETASSESSGQSTPASSASSASSAARSQVRAGSTPSTPSRKRARTQ